VDFDAHFGKPPGVDLSVLVDRDGRDAATCERERGRLARAGETEHERAAWEPHGLRAVR
jgi:hypothetical protein